MSQQSNLAAAFVRVATSINTLNGRVGTLSVLNTTDKTSIVAALNEVLTLIGGSGAVIDDLSTTTATTWSSTKIQNNINAAITALVSGAPGAQDTLAELAAQITALAAVDTQLVSVGGPQAFSAAQQLQGCQNLDIGDPTHNYVTALDTAFSGSGL